MYSKDNKFKNKMKEELEEKLRYEKKLLEMMPAQIVEEKIARVLCYKAGADFSTNKPIYRLRHDIISKEEWDNIKREVREEMDKLTLSVKDN